MFMELQIFSNSEFGEIRTITKDDETYFVGKDVAKALGFTNPRDAIATHVFDEDKGVDTIDTLGGKQSMTVINESGVYALVFGSRLESARRFKHWVTSEVLPSIRKTGSYSKPLTTSEQIRLLAQGNTELTERVDKVEDKITSIEEETPLYGCEIEEVQKHVRKKGIEVLGGKDSNAYKDGGIRGSVYSDIYKQLKREFGCVATYKSIKRKYLADVHEFIDTYLLPIALAEVVHDTNM
jgi:prophage antirepressor-like protein